MAGSARRCGDRRRGLPMMEVLTLAIRKTATCPTLPSRALISMPSAAWAGSASQPLASASSPPRRSWSAGSSRTILVAPSLRPGRSSSRHGPRTMVHAPLGWRPMMLQVRVRRYRCPDCCTVWRQDIAAAAASRTKLSRDAVLWALKMRGRRPDVDRAGRREPRHRLAHRERRCPAGPAPSC